MKKQKGAGLIEVLVTLFIISVGMLGIAGLQTVGMQAGQETSLRTSAVLVVEDIISRMQANRKGVQFYTAGTGNLGTNNNCHDNGGATTTVTACTPEMLAKHDILLWKNNLRAVLPEAEASVTVGSLINGVVQVDVVVGWKVRGKNKNYSSEFRIYTI
jgi:type IV pilus assembly protein PilV